MPPSSQERRRRVARLRLLEGGHSVADGLDPGQRRAARRERPRHQEHHREAEDVTVFGLHGEPRGLGLQVVAEHEYLEQPPQPTITYMPIMKA